MQRKKILSKNTRVSENVPLRKKYIYWFNRIDTSWMTYDMEKGTAMSVTKGSFYDELNDRPMHPYPSGFLHWMDNDRMMLIYDHYDIWKVDPTGKTDPVNVTQGRNRNLRYRYVRLDG